MIFQDVIYTVYIKFQSHHYTVQWPSRMCVIAYICKNCEFQCGWQQRKIYGNMTTLIRKLTICFNNHGQKSIFKYSLEQESFIKKRRKTYMSILTHVSSSGWITPILWHIFWQFWDKNYQKHDILSWIYKLCREWTINYLGIKKYYQNVSSRYNRSNIYYSLYQIFLM